MLNISGSSVDEESVVVDEEVQHKSAEIESWPKDIRSVRSLDSGYTSMSKATETAGSKTLDRCDSASVAFVESRVTQSSVDATRSGGAAQEVAELLLDDAEIQAHAKAGFSSQESEKFQRTLMRLLKIFASDFRNEAHSEGHKKAIRIVHSYRAYVTRIIKRRVTGPEHKDQNATAFHEMKSRNTTRLMLERFLSDGCPATDLALAEHNPPDDLHESKSEVESDDEQPYLPNLGQLTSFLTESKAFLGFKTGLRDFVEGHRTENSVSGGIHVDKQLDRKPRVHMISEYGPFVEETNQLLLIESQAEDDVLTKSEAIERTKETDIFISNQKLDHQEKSNGLRTTSMWKTLRNAVSRFQRPPHHPEFTRLEWTCDCGDALYQDFSSSSQKTIDKLGAMVNSRGMNSRPHSGTPSPDEDDIGLQNPSGPSEDVNRRQVPAQSFESGTNSSISQLVETSAQKPPTVNKSTYFELCINTGSFQKSLGELDVTGVSTDGQFFAAVNKHYYRLRSFRSRFWLLKPAIVSYVKFSVEDRYRVGLLKWPLELPPVCEVDAKRYTYSPCPLADELPISSENFIHYSFNCSSSSKNMFWLHRLPRKLESSIFSGTGPVALGWGIYINEKVDTLKVLVLNLVFLVVSGLAALLWNSLKHDFQGAFGFACWLIMVLNTLVTVFVAKWSQE